MKINADTNLLVRLMTADDPEQAEIARRAFVEASAVIVTLLTLCELSWVLRSTYGLAPSRVADALAMLIQTRRVVTARAAAAAGIAMLRSGGDFADAAIESLGSEMGAEVFVSFDRRAVKLLTSAGRPARLLARSVGHAVE